MKLLVLGAGAWGTALAASAAARHGVTLWARDPAQAGAIRAARENRRYLPGIALPASVDVLASPSPGELAAVHDFILIASPMAGLRGLLTALAASRVPVAWVCKGFEASATRTEGLLGHEVQAEAAPAVQAGLLTGPSFALEVA